MEKSFLKILENTVRKKELKECWCISILLEALLDPGLERPQLIILDIMMPEMDGFTFHNRLQEDKRTRRIPIIVTTAKGGIKEAFRQSASVAAFMEKPFLIEDLRGAVDKALSQGMRR